MDRDEAERILRWLIDAHGLEPVIGFDGRLGIYSATLRCDFWSETQVMQALQETTDDFDAEEAKGWREAAEAWLASMAK